MKTVYHLLDDKNNELHSSETYSDVVKWMWFKDGQWELTHMIIDWSKDTIPTHKLVKMYFKRLKE